MQKTSFFSKAQDFTYRNNALIVLIVLLCFGLLRYPAFSSENNIMNILRQSSMLGTMAIGMTFVIITAGTDLSVGSVFALSGAITAYFSPQSIILGIAIALLLAVLTGAFNGLLIAKCNVTPFVATLCTMMALRGVVHIMTNERPIQLDREMAGWFYEMSGKHFLFLPLLAWIFLVLLLVAWLILRYTRFGRNVYAVGGNLEASKMMGLSVSRTIILTYSLSGLMAGISGLMMCSRTGAAYPLAGNGWEMNAIAAVVLGGTMMSGGVGNVIGTFFGTLIIGCISNMINLEGTLGSSWQYIINGMALLIAVLLMQLQMIRRPKLNG